MKRLPVIVTFLLLLALCASAAYWTMQLWRPPVRAVAAPIVVAGNDVPLDAAASLFGGRAAAVGVATNFQLKGVVVAANGRESVAIISADGKPAQAVGLGTEFQPGVSIREVHSQYVLVSESGTIKRVALPDAVKSGTAELNAVAVPQLPPIQNMPAFRPPPALDTAPQPLPQVVNPPPAIGQMSTQLTQPLLGAGQGQQNPSGGLATMPGANPNGVPSNVPPGMTGVLPPPVPGTSGDAGSGGYSQPRRP